MFTWSIDASDSQFFRLPSVFESADRDSKNGGEFKMGISPFLVRQRESALSAEVCLDCRRGSLRESNRHPR
jgi:hypothetical protein